MRLLPVLLAFVGLPLVALAPSRAAAAQFEADVIVVLPHRHAEGVELEPAQHPLAHGLGVAELQVCAGRREVDKAHGLAPCERFEGRIYPDGQARERPPRIGSVGR